ncbi:hypothetical protein [Halobacillus amylolyticus]|uniref:Uncharacterized protein n=1 Tax=Halobacillus amylolyticus TaxID=2932259 RepID=A0ABY4HCN4_9BACI|nr:hypothetical protein [Halobacillus amylolyticus]UOR12192.1 hypothetical protein MUO15_01240 [Halobacillus amylolyticus]
MQEILVGVLVPILTALISYLGARHSASTELQKVKDQQQAELKKLEEQQKAEIKKIQEQSKADIERTKAEVLAQAELYEKNAQTDQVSKIFEQMFQGDLSMDDLEKMGKQFDSGTYKHANHPANKR